MSVNQPVRNNYKDDCTLPPFQRVEYNERVLLHLHRILTPLSLGHYYSSVGSISLLLVASGNTPVPCVVISTTLSAHAIVSQGCDTPLLSDRKLHGVAQRELEFKDEWDTASTDVLHPLKIALSLFHGVTEHGVVPRVNLELTKCYIHNTMSTLGLWTNSGPTASNSVTLLIPFPTDSVLELRRWYVTSCSSTYGISV